MDRRLKTHPNQWKVFLDFAERNPVVVTKKMEGPFGRDTYEKLWDELTNILNSLGYLQKSKEKWQKAVSDWKSKTRSKAADIKIELKKTGGGGQGKQLSENEKRLIGLFGWTSIRGDGTDELGIQSVAGSEETSFSQSNSVDHSYSFQIEPTPLRNVERSPPPLFPLEKKTVTDIEAPSTSSTIEKDKAPLRFTKKIPKRKLNPLNKKSVPANLEKMHTETMNILSEINTNIKHLAESQAKMCNIHEDLLGYLKDQI